MSPIIKDLREELIRNADEKTKKSGERFFKEKVRMYGIRSAVVVSTGKEHFKNIAEKEKNYIFSLCEELWKSGIMEESFVACNWSYYVHKQYENHDFEIFEGWISKYINNWASCDTFCNHTMGTMIDMYPARLNDLKRWAVSKNMWMRRAAAVSLIIPARRGRYLRDIFEIADILLSDKEDLVQKGYGWMLKSASQAWQKVVFDYVVSKKALMPRTALRYAIEKMPEELKTAAMAK